MLFFSYLCNMIELGRYIETLLLDHECVILPELGGFVVRNEISSRTDEGMICPPYRSVGFNPQLVVNDGLLVQLIMQVYDTDFSSASRMLEESIREVRNMLAAGGSWSVGGIGTLKMAEEGACEFVPSSKDIVSPGYYGLEAFPFPLFSQIAEERKTAAVADAVVSEEGDGDAGEAVAVAGEETERRNIISLWAYYGRRSLRYAGVVVLALLAFFATSIPVHDVSKDVQIAKFSVLDGALYKFPALGNVSDKQDSPLRESLAAETEAVGPAKEKEVREEIPSDSLQTQGNTVPEAYTIVLASQVRKSNAEDLVRRLAKKGFGKAEVYEGRNMIRVIYSSYPTERDAYNALRSLQKESGAFDEAWVLFLKG